MRKSVIFTIILVLTAIPLFAQNNPTGDEKVYEPVKYLPIHRFPLSILHVYRYTDTTEVIKLLPDSTKTSYKRIITHYFTLKKVKADQDGFMTLQVSLDSMRYYLKEGRAEIYWDSQDENSGGINMQDLKYSSVPLGHYFDMTFSPYGEIAKISGENVDWYFDYLNKYLVQLKDTVEKFIWFDGMSLKRLGQITNLKKINFTEEKIAIDSIWITPFEIQVENINFVDTIKAKISDVQNGHLKIEADTKNLKAIPGNYLFYGIKDMLLPVKKSEGVGKYYIDITPRGNIEKARGEFLTNLEIPVHKDVFKLQIKSFMQWDLLGMYRE
jgi:hypothetical protein